MSGYDLTPPQTQESEPAASAGVEQAKPAVYSDDSVAATATRQHKIEHHLSFLMRIAAMKDFTTGSLVRTKPKYYK